MNPEKPVLLVHASGLDHRRWDRPDRQGRLHILAAAELYRRGRVSKLFFAGGEYKRGKLPMGQVMEDCTKRLLRVVLIVIL